MVFLGFNTINNFYVLGGRKEEGVFYVKNYSFYIVVNLITFQRIIHMFVESRTNRKLIQAVGLLN